MSCCLPMDCALLSSLILACRVSAVNSGLNLSTSLAFISTTQAIYIYILFFFQCFPRKGNREVEDLRQENISEFAFSPSMARGEQGKQETRSQRSQGPGHASHIAREWENQDFIETSLAPKSSFLINFRKQKLPDRMPSCSHGQISPPTCICIFWKEERIVLLHIKDKLLHVGSRSHPCYFSKSIPPALLASLP